MNEFELNKLLQIICDTLNVAVLSVKADKGSQLAREARQIFACKAFDKGTDSKRIGKLIHRRLETVDKLIKTYLDSLQLDPIFRGRVRLVENALQNVQKVAA
jgi:hypothetical protein